MGLLMNRRRPCARTHLKNLWRSTRLKKMRKEYTLDYIVRFTTSSDVFSVSEMQQKEKKRRRAYEDLTIFKAHRSWQEEGGIVGKIALFGYDATFLNLRRVAIARLGVAQ